MDDLQKELSTPTKIEDKATGSWHIVRFGPYDIVIKQTTTIPGMTYGEGPEKVDLPETTLYEGEFHFPAPYHMYGSRASFYISGGSVSGSMGALQDKKRVVAKVELKSATTYGFELIPEKIPTEDDVDGKGASDADGMDKPYKSEPLKRSDTGSTAASESEDHGMMRDEVAVGPPARDVYAEDGPPPQPSDQEPATLKIVKLFVVYDEAAVNKFTSPLAQDLQAKKIQANLHFHVILNGYIKKPFKNLGVINGGTVGYSFDVTFKYVQNYGFNEDGAHSIGCDESGQYIVDGNLDNLLDFGDFEMTAFNVMDAHPNEFLPIHQWIIITGKNIRGAGGRAGEIGGFWKAFTGTTSRDYPSFSTNHVLVQSRGAVNDFYEEFVYTHELGHIFGAYHTHQANSPAVLAHDMPDECGTKCDDPNSEEAADYGRNWFQDDVHQGTIMSYCHACNRPKMGMGMLGGLGLYMDKRYNFFQPWRFWEGNKELMRNDFANWNALPWRPAINKGESFGSGRLISKDRRCVAVFDPTGNIQVIARGTHRTVHWSVGGELVANSKLEFANNGQLKHVEQDGTSIYDFAPIAQCGAADCKLVVEAENNDAQGIRPNSCKLKVYAGDQVVWSNQDKVYDIARNCEHNQGDQPNVFTEDSPTCICDPPSWGEPGSVANAQKPWCKKNVDGFAIGKTVSVWGDCPHIDGTTRFEKIGCQCGTKSCGVSNFMAAMRFNGRYMYCYAAANECERKCPDGQLFSTFETSKQCICSNDGSNVLAEKSKQETWCDSAAKTVYKLCEQTDGTGTLTSPCVCGKNDGKEGFTYENDILLCDLPKFRCDISSPTGCIAVEDDGDKAVASPSTMKANQMQKLTILLAGGIIPILIIYYVRSQKNYPEKELLLSPA